MGLFDEIRVWDEHDLEPAFLQKWEKKLVHGTRGFGYWVWKPYIILKALENMAEGDILLYLDVGCHLNSHARKRLLKYIEETETDPLGVKAFPVSIWKPERAYEKTWTKDNIFDYFQCIDDLQVTDTNQLESGHIFIRKCDTAVNLVQEWQKAYETNFALIDDSPSISTNFPDFIENRHDQSIFSILYKLRGGRPFPQGETIPSILTQPIWSSRDKWGARVPFIKKTRETLFHHTKFLCFRIRNLFT